MLKYRWLRIRISIKKNIEKEKKEVLTGDGI